MAEDNIIHWPQAAQEEYEVLKAIYDENVRLRNAPDSRVPELLITINDEAGQIPACDVVVVFTESYPILPPRLTVISRGGIGREKERLQEFAERKAEELSGVDSFLFDLFEAVKEEVWGIQLRLQTDSLALDIETVVEEKFPKEYARVYFWTHHCRVKQNDVIALANEMGVGGVVFMGKPGIIIGEGPRDVVEKWQKEVKSWSWKEILERDPDIFSVESESDRKKKCKFLGDYEIILPGAPGAGLNDKLDTEGLKKMCEMRGLRAGLFAHLIGIK
eukprot:gene903-257_t